MEIVKTHQIKGFDTNGEPEVHEMENGSIQIMFNFMPPLDNNGDDREEKIWDNFNEYLSAKLGVNVIWEDRELFIIPESQDDTLNKIIHLLNSFEIEE